VVGVYRGGVSYRHFVFDLDGTLIDSRQDLADAANAMLATYEAGPLPVPDVVRMVGEGARTLVERALRQAAVEADADADEALARFLAAYDERLAVHTRPYDGVPALLEALAEAGCRLSVLTNKPQRATDGVLDALGLRDAFAAVLGGDTTHGRKPDPVGLRALIAEAGVPDDATILVGDSWVDLDTARAGGIDACLAAYGFGAEAVDADRRAGARVIAHSPLEVRALAHARPPAPSMPPASRG